MPKTMWNCEKCGSSFEQKVDAEKCEAHHLPVKTVEAVYGVNYKLPNKIKVELDVKDGVVEIEYEIPSWHIDKFYDLEKTLRKRRD